MEKKLKIYLCDFVHNYSGVSTSMFPLNIGYLTAYSNKLFPEKLDITLFKYPNDFLEQFKKEAPDVVGFSNYLWSLDLNKRVSDLVKASSPQTIVVFGGPNIDYSDKGYEKFFKGHPSADFYVLYQGEISFTNILRRIIEKGTDIARLKVDPIDGVVFQNGEGKIVLGNLIPRIKNIDEIPSPYLTGILDKFFEEKLIPILETNRGCPYSCTYCCQGFSSYNQIEFFNLDRVKAELRYVAERVKNTNILIFADSNFGILERDVEIAKYIAELIEKTGWPRRVSMNWAKNQPKIFEIAKILKNINLIISLQSLDEVVLKNIKRQNVETAVFKNIIERVNEEGGVSGTEIILALPTETKQSHINSIRKLFDWNVSFVICYNCFILEGSEMSLQREKGELKCKTKFRLVDNAFGKYGAIQAFETEEGIRQLDTMSEEDILFFRPVHWLIQFLWNYRFYYDLLKYLQGVEINPLDFIISLIENIDSSSASEKVKEIFKDFRQEARDEWFDSPEALREYYMKPENFEKLEKGNSGKMNNKYIFRILLEAKEEFEKYLYDVAACFPAVSDLQKEAAKDIVSYLSSAIIDFNKDWKEASVERQLNLMHDVLKWRDSKYEKGLERADSKYVFYLPEEQEQALSLSLKQYEHPNKNVTLRKMAEYMNLRDFFYKAKLYTER